MKPEIKAKWVAALRSGDYQQGRKRLRSQGDEFCCLGVLCDIHSKETGMAWERLDGEWSYCTSAALLRGAVHDWAGIGPCGELPGTLTSLTSLNDNGTTFSAIADFIEAAP